MKDKRKQRLKGFGELGKALGKQSSSSKKPNKGGHKKTRKPNYENQGLTKYPHNLDINTKNLKDFSFSLLFSKLKPRCFMSKLPPYKKNKMELLKKLSEDYGKYINSDFVRIKLRSLHKTFEEHGFLKVKATLRNLRKKMIIGAGNESALENGITLHHIYGFPYIPASAVKGVLRYVALLEKFGDDPKVLEEKDKELAKKSLEEIPHELKDFIYIFGNQNARGKVIFSDGLPDPDDIPKLSFDILNPHYTEYYKKLYSGENVKWTEEFERGDPTPIYFPVIKDGSFVFYFKLPKYDEKLLKYIKSLFEKAFQEGFGSKTRYGYGLLNI